MTLSDRINEEVACPLGQAAGNLVGHLGDNTARLVGTVIADAAQVSRCWHELHLAVILTWWRSAAGTTMEAVKRVVAELERTGSGAGVKNP